MTLKKITEADLAGKGVIGMADTPNLSAREMQEKVEEVVRDVVIPFFNANVERTASKQDLADAVFSAGSGDMNTAVYDADGDGVVDRAHTADNGVNIYTHSKTGTVHSLTGTGNNIKFTTVAAWEPGDTLLVNGTECRCWDQYAERAEDSELFGKGVVVTAVLSWATVSNVWNCFFKTGGAGIPDGETTPANDIKKWQKCAGLNTNYDTGDEILADSEAMAALVNSVNAMNYFIRSTDIQAVMLADSRFIACLDASLPVVSHSMSSASDDYAAVTHKGYDYGAHIAFQYPAVMTETSPSAYLGNVEGAYVQYEFKAEAVYPWVYKLNIASYATRQYRIAAILEDDSMVYLTDWVDNVAPLLPSVNQEIVMQPHTQRCKAVRIYTIGDAVNNYNYLKGGKIWGK